MKVALPFLLCLFCSGLINGQQLDNRLVTVGDATLDVPADQVVLSINLSYSDDKDASLVYELHQLNQQKLAGVLKALKIEDAAIAYAPVLTRKERDFTISGSGGGTQERIKSFQQVTVTMRDMKLFAAVQRRLVTDGFADVSTTFRVSNQQDIENQLLLKAIGRAREKADLMAKAVSRTIKRVVRLSDAEESENAMLRTLMGGGALLTQPRYAAPMNQTTQTIHLASQVKLVVELE